MGLTSIFQAYGISLKGEVFKEILHTNMYDDQSLHRMEYRKVGGRWIRRGSGKEVKPNSKDEIQAIEAGASELVADSLAKVERSELDTPLAHAHT